MIYACAVHYKSPSSTDGTWPVSESTELHAQCRIRPACFQALFKQPIRLRRGVRTAIGQLNSGSSHLFSCLTTGVCRMRCNGAKPVCHNCNRRANSESEEERERSNRSSEIYETKTCKRRQSGMIDQ